MNPDRRSIESRGRCRCHLLSLPAAGHVIVIQNRCRSDASGVNKSSLARLLRALGERGNASTDAQEPRTNRAASIAPFHGLAEVRQNWQPTPRYCSFVKSNGAPRLTRLTLSATGKTLF